MDTPVNISRPKINGMALVAERDRNKYESAILIQDERKVENVHERVSVSGLISAGPQLRY